MDLEGGSRGQIQGLVQGWVQRANLGAEMGPQRRCRGRSVAHPETEHPGADLAVPLEAHQGTSVLVAGPEGPDPRGDPGSDLSPSTGADPGA